LCGKLSEKIEGAVAAAENIAILYHAQGGGALATVSSGAREGSNNLQTDTKTLLTMAKAFVEAL
jgi:hypothetical protein